MKQYFTDQGVPIPSTTNPAEFMIDVVSGSQSNGRDWAKVWLESQYRVDRMKELDELNSGNAGTPRQEDNYEYASPFSAQVAIVCERAFVQVNSCRVPSSCQLWRDVEYVMNKVLLHISISLAGVLDLC